MQFLDKLPWQGGESSEEVLVSLTFDFVFVYLRPHFGKGGYCAQRRLVPVLGSRLLIKPLHAEWQTPHPSEITADPVIAQSPGVVPNTVI